MEAWCCCHGPLTSGKGLHCCSHSNVPLLLSGSSLLSRGSGCGQSKGKEQKLCKLVMHTENLWSPLDPKCLEMFLENPLKRPLLWVSLCCCCLIARAVVHRNGGSLVFILSPNGSFSPLVLSSSVIPLILSFAPVSGGPCHFKENRLSPYSGKPVGVSTKTQYYFSYQNYGRKDLSMFLY